MSRAFLLGRSLQLRRALVPSQLIPISIRPLHVVGFGIRIRILDESSSVDPAKHGERVRRCAR